MSLGSLLGGKAKTYKADPLAKDINAAGKLGLSGMTNAYNELNDKVYANPDAFVNSQIDLENNALRASGQDASRGLAKMIASRGMQNSSIGIGQQIGLDKQLSDRMALNKASSSSRLKDLLGEKMNVSNQMFGIKTSQGPIQMQDIKQKQGGLAPLIGAGVGAYFGGAGGAQVGSGLGQYLSA